MASLSSKLSVCPHGVWVTEDHAVQLLGLDSKQTLKQKIQEGSLPHVQAQHGSRVQAPSPFDHHRFFYIQAEGTTVDHLNVSLVEWANICLALESGLAAVDTTTVVLVAKYAGRLTSQEEVAKAYHDLQSVNAIISPNDLSNEIDEIGDYNYAPIQTKSAVQEGEIYIREDGKKVRRIKRTNSPTPTYSKQASAGSLSAEGSSTPAW